MTLHALEPTFVAIYTPSFRCLNFLFSISWFGPPMVQSPVKITTKREWFFVQSMMEVNGRTSHSNDKRPFESSAPPNEQKMPAENSQSTSVFVNNGLIAWNESRRKWTGNVSQRSERTIKDPIISWSTTYEDLLSTHDPFSEPIPLSEMVDFLVDIWLDEGLFD